MKNPLDMGRIDRTLSRFIDFEEHSAATVSKAPFMMSLPECWAHGHLRASV